MKSHSVRLECANYVKAFWTRLIVIMMLLVLREGEVPAHGGLGPPARLLLLPPHLPRHAPGLKSLEKFKILPWHAPDQKNLEN